LDPGITSESIKRKTPMSGTVRTPTKAPTKMRRIENTSRPRFKSSLRAS
jgi:hypothetical protein